MSKAEEKGYEAYPVSFYEGTTVDVNEMPRYVFVEGYHQAEKDNELTWEDLKTLDDISDDVYAECDVEMFNEEEYYQEVLKRFKERRK